MSARWAVRILGRVARAVAAMLGAAGLAGLVLACEPVVAQPSLVVGEVALSPSGLVPERLVLTLPVFNLREADLLSYRAEMVLEGDTDAASPQRWQLSLDVNRPIAGRRRAVHELRFDPPYGVVPSGGVRLASLLVSAISFSDRSPAEPIHVVVDRTEDSP